MKIIRFRAYDTGNKSYTYATLGDLICGACTESGDKKLSGNVQIWEQDTGLKDKNGKDIYEGDIISFENEKGLARVLWLDGKAMFGIEWLDCGVKDELDYWNVCRGPAEVVGNIHEDCELFGRDNK